MLLKIKSFSSTSVSVYRINKNRSSTAKSNFNFKTEFQLTLQTDHFVKNFFNGNGNFSGPYLD